MTREELIALAKEFLAEYSPQEVAYPIVQAFLDADAERERLLEDRGRLHGEVFQLSEDRNAARDALVAAGNSLRHWALMHDQTHHVAKELHAAANKISAALSDMKLR